MLPPLPSAPPKPSTPPPPPPPPPSCSPPPPPPPPPVISSTVEFGSKLSEINYADECTTATPMVSDREMSNVDDGRGKVISCLSRNSKKTRNL